MEKKKRKKRREVPEALPPENQAGWRRAELRVFRSAETAAGTETTC